MSSNDARNIARQLHNGGMTEGLSRKAQLFFSVPTMLAVTVYSVFVKTWGKGTAVEMKGYEMILQDENHINLLLETLLPLLLLLAVKKFISVLTKYGFKFWGWYHYNWYRTINLFYTK
jgi:undecaprenyl-diphosphatase